MANTSLSARSTTPRSMAMRRQREPSFTLNQPFMVWSRVIFSITKRSTRTSPTSPPATNGSASHNSRAIAISDFTSSIKSGLKSSRTSKSGRSRRLDDHQPNALPEAFSLVRRPGRDTPHGWTDPIRAAALSPRRRGVGGEGADELAQEGQERLGVDCVVIGADRFVHGNDIDREVRDQVPARYQFRVAELVAPVGHLLFRGFAMPLDLPVQVFHLRDRIGNGEVAGVLLGSGRRAALRLGRRLVGNGNEVMRDERRVVADRGDVGPFLLVVAVFFPERRGMTAQRKPEFCRAVSLGGNYGEVNRLVGRIPMLVGG